ncbi:hypothetical protein FAIPA1_140001 [Frankia sp. AiPs1]
MSARSLDFQPDDITPSEGDPDTWKCRCGNLTGIGPGFFHLEGTREVDPAREPWPSEEYLCPECGRVCKNGENGPVVVRRLHMDDVILL